MTKDEIGKPAVRDTLRQLGKASVIMLLAQLALFTPAQAQVADEDVIRQLTDGNHVLMVRHALAPGTGDPSEFRLGDCTTQRNLDARGRAQARAIGIWLRARGVSAAQVYSSQWCRCLETARLMGFGPVLELPALNSFYEQSGNREPNLQALREFLATRPAEGLPTVLVTHHVTIAAITGLAVSSGEGVVVALEGADRYIVRSRPRFED
ncbi:MAG: phosphohistidine phosphatase SixA [Gammaproteobacteria bacterium]|jgi:phosphohistidine phosphatase SixA